MPSDVELGKAFDRGFGNAGAVEHLRVTPDDLADRGAARIERNTQTVGHSFDCAAEFLLGQQ